MRPTATGKWIFDRLKLMVRLSLLFAFFASVPGAGWSKEQRVNKNAPVLVERKKGSAANAAPQTNQTSAKRVHPGSSKLHAAARSQPVTLASNPLTSAPISGHAMALSPFERQWGVQILGVRQTAKGYMLNFRFRVLDAEKAQGLFNRKDKPYLIDQASGARFIVPSPPKVGPLRSSGIKPRPNRNYFMFFANPGMYVKRGNKVTIVVGKFKAENLTVE